MNLAKFSCSRGRAKMSGKGKKLGRIQKQVRLQLKLFRERHPDWKQYEKQMGEIAASADNFAKGDPMDVYLEKLYRAAKAMDKKKVEIANA